MEYDKIIEAMIDSFEPVTDPEVAWDMYMNQLNTAIGDDSEEDDDELMNQIKSVAKNSLTDEKVLEIINKNINYDLIKPISEQLVGIMTARGETNARLIDVNTPAALMIATTYFMNKGRLDKVYKLKDSGLAEPVLWLFVENCKNDDFYNKIIERFNKREITGYYAVSKRNVFIRVGPYIDTNTFKMIFSDISSSY